MNVPNALSSLQFVDAVRPRSIPAVQQRRNKLSNKLWEQIQLARAQAEGTQFTLTRFRTVMGEDGLRRSVEVPRRVRAWWWITENNKLALNIRYGTRKIEITKGKAAVEMASIAELVPTLELIKQAVEAGELDAQIEAASVKLREGFVK